MSGIDSFCLSRQRSYFRHKKILLTIICKSSKTFRGTHDDKLEVDGIIYIIYMFFCFLDLDKFFITIKRFKIDDVIKYIITI